MAQAETTTTKTTVEVPGKMVATYENGRIVGWTFSPWGSYAGYFGPAATVEDGDGSLDVESTEGEFWTAVQDNLATYNGTFIAQWEE